MSTLYENICELCEQKGVKPGKMCNDLKISRSTVTDLKAGRKKTLNAETVQKIAEYLGVSADRVMRGSNPSNVYIYFESNEPTDVSELMQRAKDEAAEYLQAVHDRPQLKVLFKRGKNATPEKLDAILALLGGNDDED